jgi:hypothetical protein
LSLKRKERQNGEKSRVLSTIVEEIRSIFGPIRKQIPYLFILGRQIALELALILYVQIELYLQWKHRVKHGFDLNRHRRVPKRVDSYYGLQGTEHSNLVWFGLMKILSRPKKWVMVGRKRTNFSIKI